MADLRRRIVRRAERRARQLGLVAGDEVSRPVEDDEAVVPRVSAWFLESREDRALRKKLERRYSRKAR